MGCALLNPTGVCLGAVLSSVWVPKEDAVRSPNDPPCPCSPLQLESYIQRSMRPELAQLRQTAVQNQTAAMLEMGSTLLNQSAQQSRKLTDVEAQVGGGQGMWHICPHVLTTPRTTASGMVSLLLKGVHRLMHQCAEVPGLCAGEMQAQ